MKQQFIVFLLLISTNLSRSEKRGQDREEVLRTNALNALLEVKKTSMKSSTGKFEHYALEFIEAYKQAMKYNTSKNDYAFSIEMRDCWKVYFNLANKSLKARKFEKALYYFDELEKLDPAHSPFVWWKVHYLSTSSIVWFATRFQKASWLALFFRFIL